MATKINFSHFSECVIILAAQGWMIEVCSWKHRLNHTILWYCIQMESALLLDIWIMLLKEKYKIINLFPCPSNKLAYILEEQSFFMLSSRMWKVLDTLLVMVLLLLETVVIKLLLVWLSSTRWISSTRWLPTTRWLPSTRLSTTRWCSGYPDPNAGYGSDEGHK